MHISCIKDLYHWQAQQPQDLQPHHHLPRQPASHPLLHHHCCRRPSPQVAKASVSLLCRFSVEKLNSHQIVIRAPDRMRSTRPPTNLAPQCFWTCINTLVLRLQDSAKQPAQCPNSCNRTLPQRKASITQLKKLFVTLRSHAQNKSGTVRKSTRKLTKHLGSHHGGKASYWLSIACRSGCMGRLRSRAQPFNRPAGRQTYESGLVIIRKPIRPPGCSLEAICNLTQSDTR